MNLYEPRFNFILFVVLSSCENINACELVVNNQKFGNPCGNTTNILEVFYDCIDETSTQAITTTTTAIDINTIQEELITTTGEDNIITATTATPDKPNETTSVDNILDSAEDKVEHVLIIDDYKEDDKTVILEDMPEQRVITLPTTTHIPIVSFHATKNPIEIKCKFKESELIFNVGETTTRSCSDYERGINLFKCQKQ